jgi:hypothetical protein
MSEVVRPIPESVANARPKEEQTALKYPDAKAAVAAFWNRGRKPRRQTWEDVERSAAFRAEIHEAVEQYWANMTKSEAEGARRIPWWVLLLAFLGAILPGEEDLQGEVQPSELPV